MPLLHFDLALTSWFQATIYTPFLYHLVYKIFLIYSILLILLSLAPRNGFEPLFWRSAGHRQGATRSSSSRLGGAPTGSGYGLSAPAYAPEGNNQV